MNNPQDLYDWLKSVRMKKPRDCQELLSCIKAILRFLETTYRSCDSSYKSNIRWLRKRLLYREDLAWSIDDLEKIRGIIHWEVRSRETRRLKQEKKAKKPNLYKAE